MAALSAISRAYPRARYRITPATRWITCIRVRVGNTRLPRRASRLRTAQRTRHSIAGHPVSARTDAIDAGLSGYAIRIGHAGDGPRTITTITAIAITTDDHGINTCGQREHRTDGEKSLMNEAS